VVSLDAGRAWTQQGGSAIAFQENGTYVYVAQSQGNAVSWVQMDGLAQTSGLTPVGGLQGWSTTAVGRFPDGLAIKRDQTVGYVHNGFDHTVMTLVGDEHAGTVDAQKTINVGSDVLPPDVVEGRKLFFDSTNLAVTGGTLGAACTTCHLDGQDDGHTWQLADGKRQTPPLSGGRLDGTAPYHWAGDVPTLENAITKAIARMGGTGIDAQQMAQLEAFLRSLPAPGNPLRAQALSDSAMRGEVLFYSAGCADCHNGAKLTNNTFADVGTDISGFPSRGANVPSLIGVARSAPYLHDGSALTLRARLVQGGDRHGQTSALSPEQIDDLVAYLERL
jgi:cytochrome c peroxidase